MAEEQTLEVTIQNIVFQSDQGTFCVFRGEIGISVQCLLSIRA